MVGRIRLDDAHERNTFAPEARSDFAELLLSRNDEAHRVCAGREVAGAAFARGVDYLGCLEPSREVCSHDHVVGDRELLLGTADIVAIAGRSWGQSNSLGSAVKGSREAKRPKGVTSWRLRTKTPRLPFSRFSFTVSG